LSWIGVDEDYQRTNLGQRLYRRLEERLRKDGIRMMIADTDVENEGAIAFFRSMKFTLTTKHQWMVKTLKRPKKSAKQNDNNHAK
jgi:ribosomal protein S18 acetylase RimI-like enzyme